MATKTHPPAICHANPPHKCDDCGVPIPHTEGAVFFDMKSGFGPWGNFCHSCACWHSGTNNPESHMGTGRGQQYRYDAKIEQFVKIAG